MRYPILPSGTEAEDIDDDLMTRCLILSAEDSVVALIALDVHHIGANVGRAITDRASNTTGLPTDSIYVVATGNATSPVLEEPSATRGIIKRYTDFLPDIVGGNAARAVARLEPAAVASITVQTPNICNFRDQKDIKENTNRLTTSHLMAVQNSNADIIAAVVSTPCPACVRAPTNRWTADYPGALCWMLQQFGIETPIFVQGNCDGIVPFDWYEGNPNPSHQDHSVEDANALALIIATQIAQAIPMMEPRRNVEPREFVASFLGDILSAR